MLGGELSEAIRVDSVRLRKENSELPLCLSGYSHCICQSNSICIACCCGGGV